MHPGLPPALTVYEGHAGMARLVADLSAAYGPHRIEVEDITVESDTQVTAQTRVVQESDHGDLLLRRIKSVYTLRAGLVTSTRRRRMHARYVPDEANHRGQSRPPMALP